jgi:hypothetical protein
MLDSVQDNIWRFVLTGLSGSWSGNKKNTFTLYIQDRTDPNNGRTFETCGGYCFGGFCWRVDWRTDGRIGWLAGWCWVGESCWL